MLPGGDLSELDGLLQTLTCRVEVPGWYRALQARHGEVLSTVHTDERRRFARLHFLTPAILECQGNLPALKREAEPFVVLCKNLSRNGIAFLHEGPLYSGEEIALWLPIGRRSYVVRRCRRHHERCYEIGAKSGKSEAA
ncbi:MAG: hypothetical protein SH850_16285 [Planctomycetaceae bacterium]|nr:hypothetical protein [Planctomycetaceae bacterium]